MDTATYAETGDLSLTIDGVPVAAGTFDADGGEWVGPVDAMLAEAGYVRTGDWSGDTAPVRKA
jgi:hypothetical protein